jgi:hypothetical protein
VRGVAAPAVLKKSERILRPFGLLCQSQPRLGHIEYHFPVPYKLQDSRNFQAMICALPVFVRGAGL